MSDSPTFHAQSDVQSDAQTPAQARASIKELKKREGEVALAAYYAEKRSVDAKTERLRALRLAKEEADREAAKAAPPKPAAKKKVARVKKVSA